MQSSPLKAIETQFAGYRFRSRTEAKWAVFFEALGIAWQYEKEGFETSAGWYLPDFYLPDQKTWIEIKPTMPAGDDLAKIVAFGTHLHDHAQQVAAAENRQYDEILNASHGEGGIGFQFTVHDDLWVFIGSPWPSEHRVHSVIDGALSNRAERLVLCPLCRRLATILSSHSLSQGDSLNCYWCDIFDRGRQNNGFAHFHKGLVFTNDGSDITESPVLARAFATARAARFEHGENGMPRPR